MAFSVKAPRPPRWEDKNLWEMPSDSLSDASSFEVDEDFIKKEKDLITYEKQMKEAKKKEEDLFSLPKEEPFEDEKTKDGDSYSMDKEDATAKEQEESLFKTSPETTYQEINDELQSEDTHMKVVSKDSVEVDAMGQKNIVTRNDLVAYKQKYDLEDGEERPLTRFTQLGQIKGEREQMDNLSKDVSNTFVKVDERLGGYPTMSEGEY